MVNLYEILKNAPKGMLLYSPIFGEVKLKRCVPYENTISVKTKEGNTYVFNEYGQFNENGECMLFPSSNKRHWSSWQNELFEKGDIIVFENGNEKHILLHNYAAENFNDEGLIYSVPVVFCPLCRYADENECKQYIEKVSIYFFYKDDNELKECFEIAVDKYLNIY